MTGKSHGAVIAGMDQDAAKKLADRDLVSDLETDDLRAGFQLQIAPVNGDSLIHIPILEGQDRCHDLCDRCRVDLVIHISGEEDRPLFQIKERTGLSFLEIDILVADVILAGTDGVGKSLVCLERCLCCGLVCHRLIGIEHRHGQIVRFMDDIDGGETCDDSDKEDPEEDHRCKYASAPLHTLPELRESALYIIKECARGISN